MPLTTTTLTTPATDRQTAGAAGASTTTVAGSTGSGDRHGELTSTTAERERVDYTGAGVVNLGPAAGSAAADATGKAAGAPSVPLPFTGGSVRLPLFIGLLLIAAGVGLMANERRRPASTSHSHR